MCTWHIRTQNYVIRAVMKNINDKQTGWPVAPPQYHNNVCSFVCLIAYEMLFNMLTLQVELWKFLYHIQGEYYTKYTVTLNIFAATWASFQSYCYWFCYTFRFDRKLFTLFWWTKAILLCKYFYTKLFNNSKPKMSGAKNAKCHCTVIEIFLRMCPIHQNVSFKMTFAN